MKNEIKNKFKNIIVENIGKNVLLILSSEKCRNDISLLFNNIQSDVITYDHAKFISLINDIDDMACKISEEHIKKLPHIIRSVIVPIEYEEHFSYEILKDISKRRNLKIIKINDDDIIEEE